MATMHVHGPLPHQCVQSELQEESHRLILTHHRVVYYLQLILDPPEKIHWVVTQ